MKNSIIIAATLALHIHEGLISEITETDVELDIGNNEDEYFDVYCGDGVAVAVSKKHIAFLTYRKYKELSEQDKRDVLERRYYDSDKITDVTFGDIMMSEGQVTEVFSKDFFTTK